ncbi:MAG TPA: transglycosylase SLT domain-containing protein [Gemmatimonadaceae bacterium]|nr:transglycosylase SLT domain-containing protein [Gemmatimonadaceae bacterium]
MSKALVVAPRPALRPWRQHQRIALALGSLGADAALTAPVLVAIERQAARFSIDPLLVVAVIAHENPDLNPAAVSSAGATGIMQVMPQWLASFSATCGNDLLAVETNICFGIRVLQSHLEDAHGSLERALLSYVGCIRDFACRSYPGRVLNRWRSLLADDSTSIVPAALWSSLSPPDAATLDWLARRLPGLDGSTIHELTADAFDAMLADAAKRGMSPVDFFTDPGFRGREAYYVPQAAVATVLARYEVRVLTAVSGNDTDGQPFQMEGLVLGGGHVDALYDRDNFTFAHPAFDNGRYTLAARVSQVILGPGDMSIAGITAHVAFFSPTIQRITRISPTMARIKTSLGSRNKPSTPIHRR